MVSVASPRLSTALQGRAAGLERATRQIVPGLLLACVVGLVAHVVAERIFPYALAVGFEVPPGRSEVRIQNGRAGVHVANHTLARRNGARELMLDGMARLVFRNRRVTARAEARVAVLAIRPGFKRIPIIRVNDVASRAAA